LPHAQPHSVYIAYEFTILNCRITASGPPVVGKTDGDRNPNKWVRWR